MDASEHDQLFLNRPHRAPGVWLETLFTEPWRISREESSKSRQYGANFRTSSPSLKLPVAKGGDAKVSKSCHPLFVTPKSHNPHRTQGATHPI